MALHSRLRKWLLATGFGLLFGGLMLALILWLLMRSPWWYQAPPDWPLPAAGQAHELFVYGTLRHAALRRLIVGRAVPAEPAALPGFERRGLDLAPADGAMLSGLRLQLDAEALQRLDRYERLGHRYYRDCLPLADSRYAWVYRRLPASPAPAAPAPACP